MSELVAKRYIKALLTGRNIKTVNAVGKRLDSLAQVFSDEKFNSIIASPEVDDSKKVDFILSLVDKPNEVFVNFIKLLGEKRRLDLLPSIAKELKVELSRINNTYEGTVYTNKKLSDKYLSSIQEQFSKKFDVKLTLVQDIGDYDGIKVDIDGLGVEISFSKDRFKSQMINHILKAV